jgi:archaemetzincin
MKEIIILPVGSVDSDIFRAICHSLASTFHVKIEKGQEVPIPANSYNPKRGQYHATTILQKMKSARQKNHHMILGVTDVDLYVPNLNFVFGVADMSSGITVISVTRLRQEFYGLPADRRILEERAVKEAVHELGHAYGLHHCPNQECIMYFSNSLRDTDQKGPGFCKVCQNELGI